MENNFVKLAAMDVSQFIEKKNGLSYVSWAFAVDQLMRVDPAANWEFHEPKLYGETMMVSCTVTAFGKPVMMHLPVMNHRNQAIKNPDAFEVNKNMMRCLVKAIACHGLGLYIYAGEDLPMQDKQEEKPEKEQIRHSPVPDVDLTPERRAEVDRVVSEIVTCFDEGLSVQGIALWYAQESFADNDERTYAWKQLAPYSKIRSEIKVNKPTKENT